MRAMRRHQETAPSKILFIILIVLLAIVLFDSCWLLRDFSFPACNLRHSGTGALYEYLDGTAKGCAQVPASLWLGPSANSPAGPSLASQQSYGFFNDISDENWRRMQQRALTALHLKGTGTGQAVLPETETATKSSAVNPLEKNPVVSYLNNLQPEFTCPYVSRVGGHQTCDPHRLLEREECVVYSVGSDGTYVWEDALVDLLGSKHCEIHVFDSGNYARAGDPENKNIHYHKWGLDESASASSAASVASSDLVSFQDTLKRLGHQDRAINVLRIDCGDNCEWSQYKDWVTLADIRQILIETPGGNDWHQSPDKVADFFYGFLRNRFAMYSKEVKMSGGSKNSIEFGFMKLHPAFWDATTSTSSGNNENNNIVTVNRREVLDMESLPPVLMPDPPPAPFKIPLRLIFVHPTSIEESQNPVDSFLNMKHTVKKYKEIWGGTTPFVWALNEFTCLAAVHGLNPELGLFFRREKSMVRKMGICSVAALYLAGGYYHDVDLEIILPFRPADDTRLAVASDGGGLSPLFLACEPKSIVMKMTLDKMRDFYKQNLVVADSNFATQALMDAFGRVDPSLVRSEIVSLSAIGGKGLTPWIVRDTPVQKFDNPVPLDMRGPPSPHFKIPRRILFTYKTNLLKTKDPPRFYDNVQKTIRTYREAWGEPDAPVWFLDDDDCRAAIYATKPALLAFFDREIDGSWKADMCRVAALQLTGGYYFDVDMETINPWIPKSSVAFATVYQPVERGYFQSFLASEKGGRLMKEALDEMLIFYETKKSRNDILLGPMTLLWAFESVPLWDRGETVILQETKFIFNNETDSLLRREGVGFGCDYLVHDPVTKERFFYSRIVGAGKGCQPRGSPEANAYLLANELADERDKLLPFKNKPIAARPQTSTA